MSRHKDTRFVPEVCSPTEDVDVSVEELTKSRESFNLDPPWMITKILFDFHYQIPQWEGNTSFLKSTTTLVSPEQHLVHLGDKSARETDTWRSSIKCLSWGLSGSLKRMVQISPRKLRLEWALRERRFELKRERLNVFASWTSGSMSWGAWGIL
jgi:hypothetical protein